MTSFYSFLVAIVWFNIAILFVAILSRRTYFLVKYSTSVLLVCAALGIIRMLLPLEFPFTRVIRSYKIMPIIRDLFHSDTIPGSEYLKFGTVLIGVWITGTILVLINTSRQLVAEHKAYKRYVAVDSEQVRRVCAGMGLKKAEVIVSPDVKAPMMTGIFKAHIYLPELSLSDEQMKLIISHEYQHFKSFDTLIKLFYLALSALFWWNPAVHTFKNKLEQLLELRCDANITKEMNDAGKELYLSSILAVIKHLHSSVNERSFIASASLIKVGYDSLIKQRFHFVLSGNKKAPIARAAIVCILLVLFLSSYMVIIQPAGFPIGDGEEIGVRITPENAYILVFDSESMKLYVNDEFFWDVSEADLHDSLHSALPIYERRK